MAIVAPDIGIDLGTANTSVYVRGKGIVVNEPTIVVVESDNKRIVKAIGEEARIMKGRATGGIMDIHPLREGVISDFDMTKLMIQYFIREAIGVSHLVKPRVLITVPCSISPIERHAVTEATKVAGARQVHIIEKPFAAAIGSGLPVYEPVGSMVVDIGGGTTDAAVISLGGVVISHSIRVGGVKMDEAIINFIKREFNMLIGDRTAEEVKMDLGSALPIEETRRALVRGRDLITSLPQTTEITSGQVYEALSEPCLAIMSAIKWVLERTPPELAGDVMRSGIHLTGGGALLFGMDQYIASELGIPVLLAKEPMDCAAMGIGYLAENIEILHRIGKSGFLRH
jgi:rod shape-determining protein MreB